jgi:hypothetical protein
MRRPVMYLAGLLLATGASLALAGPASAAPAPRHHHHHNNYNHHHFGWWNNDLCDNDDYGYDYDYDHGSNSQNNGSHYNGIVLLSGNSHNGNGGLIGGGLL